MRETINIAPPSDFQSFSPSELFRFYFQIGHWTEDSFSGALQDFTRGKLVSTVTISKWKNRDVIPTRYSGAFLKLVESTVEPAMAKKWVTAFETVWGLHSAGRRQGIHTTDAAMIPNQICAQHKIWIEQLYFENRDGQIFSPADIYAPLQLINTKTNGSAPLDIETIIDVPKDRIQPTQKGDWVFISGRPGAGKSMAALHLAQSFCVGDVFPIYIRGSRLSNIDIDIISPSQTIGDSFSIRSFLKQFRASSFDRACLIFDGLDDLAPGSQGHSRAFSQFLADLESEQEACAAHGKVLHIIAFGREVKTELAASYLLTDHIRHYALLALDGSLIDDRNDAQLVYGQDLRAIWWGKYLTATGQMKDPCLPSFLTTEFDDFYAFGTNPHLSFLLCQTGLGNDSRSGLPHERIDRLTSAPNRNEIYKTLIEHQTKGLRRIIDERPLLALMQQMALTLWHSGDEPSISLQCVYEDIQEPDTKAAFRTLFPSGTKAQTPTDLGVSVFYHCASKDEIVTGREMVAFTHKAFAEYLLNTLIFDAFARLILAFGETKSFEVALKDWIRISSKGSHEPSLADFCQREAGQRFEALSEIDWDIALTIIQESIHTTPFGGSGGMALSHLQKSCGLLFFIWSCLNLERQKRTETAFLLSDDSPHLNTSDLKRLQPPSRVNFKTDGSSFLTQSLSALHLSFADMSQLSLGLGHIENLTSDNSNFAMTHWSFVKITSAHFSRTRFQQSIFHHGRILDSVLSHCLFQGSQFQGTRFSGCEIKDTFFSQCHFTDVEFLSCHFENVIFDRCIFSRAIFEHRHGAILPLDAKFRHCTFMNMDGALENIPPENIQYTIGQTEPETMRTDAENQALQSILDRLL